MSREIPSEPTALMFAPMIYVAWADGDLEDRELDLIGQRLGSDPELPEGCRASIRAWLDPDDPPSAGELAALLARLRSRAAALDQTEALSYRSLGERLARSEGHVPGDAELRALAALEDAVGLARADRAASILWPIRPPAPAASSPPGFDTGRLAALLVAPHAQLRADVLELLGTDEFAPPIGPIATREYRDRVHGWLGAVAARGWGALAYPPSCGGAGDVGAFLAAFETLGYGDLSLLVKFGVQFGLFGLGIQMLGTDAHHRTYLPGAGTMELAGCFAMTETDHGSNVAELETTASFVPETGELEITTPNPRARKDYIGNAANYARAALVFAQLETGGQRHGVHAFLVPIRDHAGQVLTGVLVEDCSEKIGLGGVDNGRISFNRVRVPAAALLDRFATIDADGNYHSAIASSNKRFFTMLGTLVGGRIAVASAAVSATKLALTIALRYAASRRQFGPTDAAELALLAYPRHRRRLLPRLARAFALHFAVRDLARRFTAHSETAAQGEGPATDMALESEAAAVKALATWHASDTIGECREACGGHGYLAESRFAALAADTDVFTTFEGDNTVLLQLVAKSLLSGFARGMRDLGVVGMARHIAARARAALDRNPIATRRADPEHLRSTELQSDLLRGREDDLLHSLAARLKRRIDRGADTFVALIECQEHALALAHAHGERLVFDAIAAAEDDVSPILGQLRSLYGLAAIEADRAWFLENGYFEPRKSGAVRDQVDELCAELAPQALHLVDAFGIPDAVIRAPIGRRNR